MLKVIIFISIFSLCACAFAASVNVSSPVAGTTVGTPFSVTANCNVAGADAMQVYVDSAVVYSNTANSMNHYIETSTGNHKVEVKCWVGPTPHASGEINITVAKEAGTNEVPVAAPFVNATVGSPFRVTAGCNVAGADAIQVYLDSALVYKASATSVNHDVSTSSGKHQLDIMCSAGPNNYSTGNFGITVASQTGENVVVSSPLSNTTVGTRFPVIASCNLTGADAIEAYLDSSLVYNEYGTSMNANLSAGIGTHQLEVKCWVKDTPYSTGYYQFVVGPEGGTSNVVVSSPLAGSRVASNFNVTANCDVAGAESMDVYLDSSLVYSADATAINYLANASPDVSHEVEVKCLAGGTSYSSGAFVIDPTDTSGDGFDGSSNIPIPPSYAHYVDNIQALSSWEKGETGAGPACPNGVVSATCNPPIANFNPTVEHPADPAPLAGSSNISGLFQLYDGPPSASVVWINDLFSANVRNFVYDFYLYVNSTNYSGSELDLFTIQNGESFFMGNVCYRPGNSWFTWDNDGQHWIKKNGIPCNQLLTANAWHHITIYTTANTSNNTYEYHVIRIDNVDYVLNQTQPAQPSSWANGLVGIQVQLNSYLSGDGVNEYIENSQLYAW